MPNGTIHSGCTAPTQATARLVIVLASRIQKSGTGDNNFVKWKGTFRSDRPKWPDRSKRTTFKADPEYSGRTKPKWSVPFDVATEITGILIGIRNPSSTDKNWNPVPGIHNPRCGIYNPRLSWIQWISLHKASYLSLFIVWLIVCTSLLFQSQLLRAKMFLNGSVQSLGPGCSKLGEDNPRLVRNLNSDMRS